MNPRPVSQTHFEAGFDAFVFDYQRSNAGASADWCEGYEFAAWCVAQFGHAFVATELTGPGAIVRVERAKTPLTRFDFSRDGSTACPPRRGGYA